MTGPTRAPATCDHEWVYFAGVGAAGFEDGYECTRCGEVDR